MMKDDEDGVADDEVGDEIIPSEQTIVGGEAD